MIAFVIVACEVAFWVVLAAGMLLRYPASRPRLGAVVLAGVPLVDVVLLVATGVDLARGAEFHSVHSLAAVYLGFSLAFGHSLVRWADVRFAHRFAGGPPPAPKPAAGSPERRRALWVEWFRVVLAATIAVAVLGLLSLVADPDQRAAVLGSAGPLGLVVVVWLVAGPLWESGSRRTAERA
ncbi:hypothetical protein [Nocardioides litoris]|uniref:hypothetical protein n=1 Tax=Nocardioides litoris TaxID=1926648 RepID=UPI00111D23FA|nr:hypothetical protein [Nocardioides litoris]